MRVSQKELMDKLGVGYELGPYETCPWSCYDSEQGKTCSAEVRMDPEGRELEAEIQMMHDTPSEGVPPMEQIFQIKGLLVKEQKWEIKTLRIYGEPFGEDLINWREKACNFFNAVVRELQSDTIPDIDDLIDIEFHSHERMADGSQGGGGKSPKINANQLIDMKKGGGF